MGNNTSTNLINLEANEQRLSLMGYVPTYSTRFVSSALMLLDNVEKHQSIECRFVAHVDAVYGLRLSETRLNLIRIFDLKVVASEPRSDDKAIAKLLIKYLKIKIDERNSEEE